MGAERDWEADSGGEVEAGSGAWVAGVGGWDWVAAVGE